MNATATQSVSRPRTGRLHHHPQMKRSNIHSSNPHPTLVQHSSNPQSSKHFTSVSSLAESSRARERDREREREQRRWIARRNDVCGHFRMIRASCTSFLLQDGKHLLPPLSTHISVSISGPIWRRFAWSALVFGILGFHDLVFFRELYFLIYFFLCEIFFGIFGIWGFFGILGVRCHSGCSSWNFSHGAFLLFAYRDFIWRNGSVLCLTPICESAALLSAFLIRSANVNEVDIEFESQGMCFRLEFSSLKMEREAPLKNKFFGRVWSPRPRSECFWDSRDFLTFYSLDLTFLK